MCLLFICLSFNGLALETASLQDLALSKLFPLNEGLRIHKKNFFAASPLKAQSLNRNIYKMTPWRSFHGSALSNEWPGHSFKICPNFILSGRGPVAHRTLILMMPG